MFRSTIGDLQKLLGPAVDYPMASQLVKLMELTGAAKNVGVRPPPSGKGRGAAIYEFAADTFTLNLTQPIAVVKVVEAPVFTEESGLPRKDETLVADEPLGIQAAV
jgi:hypothetical protein